MIAILEDKRAEVMANDRAGYFIHDWQELRGQVRELIAEDPRYRRSKQVGRRDNDEARRQIAHRYQHERYIQD